MVFPPLLGWLRTVRYDLPMDVQDHTALDLLRAFSKLEYLFKRMRPFRTQDHHGNAFTNWDAVMDAANALRSEQFVDRVRPEHRALILEGDRNRPAKEKTNDVPGESLVRWDPLPLKPHDAPGLIDAMRRVRNNLFHGGKQVPHEQELAGTNEDWARAACDVALRLLEAVEAEHLGRLPDR